MTAPIELVEQRHVLLCCGTGGVGKTTTAATFAIEGARRGRNAVVVTIDPAKRLANTLGLEHLSNSAHEIELLADELVLGVGAMADAPTSPS